MLKMRRNKTIIIFSSQITVLFGWPVYLVEKQFKGEEENEGEKEALTAAVGGVQQSFE